MIARVARTVLLSCVLPAWPGLAGADPVAETWDVSVAGAIVSDCVAEVERDGSEIFGVLACKQVGLRLPIRATISGGGGITPSGGTLGWTASRNGNNASGTYQSSMGAGTWSAVRQTGP